MSSKIFWYLGYRDTPLFSRLHVGLRLELGHNPGPAHHLADPFLQLNNEDVHDDRQHVQVKTIL